MATIRAFWGHKGLKPLFSNGSRFSGSLNLRIHRLKALSGEGFSLSVVFCSDVSD
jgi:hypothetical protein